MNAEGMMETAYNIHTCRSFMAISSFLTHAGLRALGRAPSLPTSAAEVLAAVKELEANLKGHAPVSRACTASFFWRAAQHAAANARARTGAAQRNALQEAFYYSSTAEFYVPPIPEVNKFVQLTLILLCAPTDPNLQLLEGLGVLAAAKIIMLGN